MVCLYFQKSLVIMHSLTVHNVVYQLKAPIYQDDTIENRSTLKPVGQNCPSQVLCEHAEFWRGYSRRNVGINFRKVYTDRNGCFGGTECAHQGDDNASDGWKNCAFWHFWFIPAGPQQPWCSYRSRVFEVTSESNACQISPGKTD